MIRIATTAVLALAIAACTRPDAPASHAADNATPAASHAAASPVQTQTDAATGGAISNSRARRRREIPGTATRSGILTLTGDVHAVTASDDRMVDVSFR